MSKPAKEVKKSPRPQTLPGIEIGIAELDSKAMDYADVRDERIRLSAQEGELKKQLLDIMKKHKLTTYKHGKIAVDIILEHENIKVKIKPAEELSHEEPKKKNKQTDFDPEAIQNAAKKESIQ